LRFGSGDRLRFLRRSFRGGAVVEDGRLRTISQKAASIPAAPLVGAGLIDTLAVGSAHCPDTAAGFR
jgi:hypothetical protein